MSAPPVDPGAPGPPSRDRRPRAPLWATLVATSFGAGFMPKAPGHTGTLTAVPMAWALSRLGGGAYLLGLAVVVGLGTWAAELFGRASGRSDDQRIVVDEVAGYLLTLSVVSRSPAHLVLGFFLFRLFDVWKPPPVRWFDRSLPGGIGVMADDLAAGVYGALVLWTLDRAGVVAALSRWWAG